MKKLLFTLLLAVASLNCIVAQEYFTIKQYDVKIKVNKDASLDIDEAITVLFTQERHGIYRLIPYQYRLQELPGGTEKANRQLEENGYAHTIIEDIKVKHWDYEVSNDGDYKLVKIGSANKYVSGEQQYVLHYRVINAINFFKDHSELYFNIIGNKWDTTIDSVNFAVGLYKPLPETPEHFIATGLFGSQENNTVTHWSNNQVFYGANIKQLGIHEGITLGISFPKDYLTQQNYALRGIYWLLLPVLIFFIVYRIWKRWGKDDEVTIKTEYYPPANVSPSLSGYIIDNKLDRRDLTALVPYWGAGGYLQVKEIENSALFGLIKSNQYQFIKLKELPADALTFEKTLFNGIFRSGDEVMLDDLKNVLYKTMYEAKKDLEKEVKRSDYYVKGSREWGVWLILIALVFGFFGFKSFGGIQEHVWTTVALFTSAIIIFFFGIFMTKKTPKGTLLYQQLLGFKEFIKSVEKGRLETFLRQDEHYFDKILPYAIVFNVVDTWKDKLKGLDIPPPTWYSGNYNTFNTANFMNSLNHSMNSMSSTFYSAPSGSSGGSSGGSFGGGGSSGGGFGGGGGGSW